jgi:hypothetical protein
MGGKGTERLGREVRGGKRGGGRSCRWIGGDERGQGKKRRRWRLDRGDRRLRIIGVFKP